MTDEIPPVLMLEKNLVMRIIVLKYVRCIKLQYQIEKLLKHFIFTNVVFSFISFLWAAAHQGTIDFSTGWHKTFLYF